MSCFIKKQAKTTNFLALFDRKWHENRKKSAKKLFWARDRAQKDANIQLARLR